MFFAKHEAERVKVGVSGLCFSLSGLLLACSPAQLPNPSSSTPQVPESQPPAINTTMPSEPAAAQRLPITAQATIANQVIQLEVAKTPQQQATGLMYRSSLASDRGMLFAFQPPRFVGFWMKNVKIPLDMVFLYQGKVVAIQKSAPPCVAEPCPTYGPQSPVDQVIELRGGRASELGVKVGDRVKIQMLQSTPARS